MLLFQLDVLSWRRVTGLLCKRVIQTNRLFFKNLSFQMETKNKLTYEEAVYALNGLQSNSAYLLKAQKERSANAHLNLLLMEEHLNALGIKVDDLNSLNAIHVAGTKGKGSTCAFSEVVLRKHGYKTGFYSSPHVVSVNERIRINGSSLSKDLFTKYFWEVYDCIQKSLGKDQSMPHYFLFLTVMAFYVFLKEQVEVAIVEVGIGGLYDCTNIIRKPIAVGITNLGIDHVNILGNSISEIAAQKAGIFKKGVQAFTVPQDEAAMKVLCEKAADIGCTLVMSPPLEAFEEKISLQAQGVVQNVNASLALQLTNAWLKHSKHACIVQGILIEDTLSEVKNVQDFSLPLPMASVFPICQETSNALKNCECPGRFQTVERNNKTFYLDSAHTYESIKHCVKWFKDSTQSVYKENVVKVLIFNCTGDRKAEILLDPLIDVPFDIVIFCPNRISIMKDASSDLSNFMVDPEKEMQQCVINREVWCYLMNSIYENEISMNSLASSSAILSRTDNILQFPSIQSALDWINVSQTGDKTGPQLQPESICNADHIQILVTGSLHLVGGVLSILQS